MKNMSLESVDEVVTCDEVKETMHSNIHKSVESNPLICERPNYKNSSDNLYKQDESIHTNTGHSTTHEQGPVHNSFSKYASLLRQLKFVILVGMTATIVGSIFAYPAVALTEEGSDGGYGLKISDHSRKWFVSIPLMVCIPGCLIAGTVVEIIGIRRALACCWVLVAVSWTIITVNTSITALIVARILQGIALSVYCIDIMYTAEISCKEYRGLLLSLTDVMVYFGIMVTYIVALFVNSSYLGITMGVIFLVPHGIGLYISPDSPVWLVRKNRLDEAKKALIRLRGCKESVDQEFMDIKKAVEEDNSVSNSVYEQLQLMKMPVVWKPMTLCLLMLLMKEFTGQYAVTTYTVSIFKMTNTTFDPYWCTAVIGIIRFFSSFCNMGLIQLMPRKVLLSGGFILSGIALAIMAIPLILETYEHFEYLPNWIPLMGLIMFSIVYTSCVNPTAWAVYAEMMPTSVKSIGGGIITTIYTTIQCSVGFTFLDLVHLLSIGGTFLLFAIFGLLGGIMVLICFPETRGKSLSQLKYSPSKDKSPQQNIC